MQMDSGMRENGKMTKKTDKVQHVAFSVPSYQSVELSACDVELLACEYTGGSSP